MAFPANLRFRSLAKGRTHLPIAADRERVKDGTDRDLPVFFAGDALREPFWPYGEGGTMRTPSAFVMSQRECHRCSPSLECGMCGKAAAAASWELSIRSGQ